ncbi:hypothetical protein [Variovorax sp. DAIF25]|uniref:hypothetical protein n=1 Tax=Variovorax sp. DAIF25 TaxID=3080983 RepID=UPI003D6B3DD5
MLPRYFARQCGSTSIPLRQWKAELESAGLDVEALWKQAEANVKIQAERYDAERARRPAAIQRARAFLTFLKTVPTLTQEELQNNFARLMDPDSMFELLWLVEEDGIVRQAQRLATRKNAENRQMKEQVFEWCDDNLDKFSSMDDAAIAVAGKVVPVKFRAVRQWMTEWRKRERVAHALLPPAGTT